MTGKALRWILLVAPLPLLLFMALPRFFDGLALDATFPIPAGMATNRGFMRESYARTAAVLAPTAAGNGEGQVIQAHALFLSGAQTPAVGRMVQRALALSPASIQGWMLLTETSQALDPRASAAALAVTMELSPNDFWLVGRKARAGAGLWDRLGGQSREDLLHQARLIWTERSLRAELVPLVRVPGGSQLMTRAIANRNEIRSINRYLSRLRRSRS